jgi:hypothetical protein
LHSQALLVIDEDAVSGYGHTCATGERRTEQGKDAGRPNGRAIWPTEDAAFERLLKRVARMPINQLVMMKLLVNQTVHAQGLTQTQVLGTFFDGIARHTEEGHAFVRRASEAGFREAVRERDEPYGDHGLKGFGLDPEQ